MRYPRLASLLASFFLLTFSGALVAQTPAVHEALAGSPSLAPFAVAKQFSHGCSCTCVYTDSKRSLFLGCAHAYEHGDARKAITLDVPAPIAAPQPIQAHPRLIAVDYRADLSLVEMPIGPLPYTMPVAPAGFRPGAHVVASGYDSMRSLVRAPTHILAAMTYTRERPIPGRSGGALYDADAGRLIGVCHGYECQPDGSVRPSDRGMYVSHGTILAFLQQKGYGWLADPRYHVSQQFPLSTAPLATPRAQAPAAPAPQPAGAISIPPSMWVPNRTGAACAWCALETLGRYHHITQLDGLSERHTGMTGPGGPDAELRRLGVAFRQQMPGNTDRALAKGAVDGGWGAMVGLDGRHCVVLVGYDTEAMTCVDNTPPRLIRVPWSAFDGWTIVVYRDAQVPKQTPPLTATPGPIGPSYQYPPTYPVPKNDPIQPIGFFGQPMRSAPSGGC